MDSATLSKPRSDSWDSELTDAQRWAVYDKFRAGRWYDVATWAREEFGLADIPSRAAMYRFADRMRSLESAHRIESALVARDEAGALVAAATDDATTINAYKTMAQDLALSGRPGDAVLYTSMALDLAAQQTKRLELELKAAAQQTKDQQLKLAREKFEAAEKRLNAVRDALTDAKAGGGLTEETLKKIEQAAGLL
jgi:hypothetical protein